MPNSTGRAGRAGNNRAIRGDGITRAVEQDSGSTQNLLLAKLSADELAELLHQGARTAYRPRDVLIETGDEIDAVYFPLTAMISLLTVLSDGISIEAMTIGHEGVAGLSVFHGITRSLTRAVCQIEGEVYRIPADKFLALVDRSPTLRAMLHRFSQFTQDSVAQSAACNGIHLIEQRCARWLLLSSDAVGDRQFKLTQEFFAQMLAVRRSGVTTAMGTLERKNLISTSYGAIRIMDRSGLEATTCECYHTVARRRDELLM